MEWQRFSKYGYGGVGYCSNGQHFSLVLKDKQRVSFSFCVCDLVACCSLFFVWQEERKRENQSVPFSTPSFSLLQ
jgi:hypothetical protein